MRRLILKLWRFGIVGVLASLNYVLFLTLFVEYFELSELPASATAFIVSVPISYAGHRNWTFKSEGRHRVEFSGFLVTAVTGFLLTLGSTVVIVEMLGLHYLISALVACGVVPVGSFITLNLLVFRRQRGGRAGPIALSDNAVDIEERSG